MLLTKRKEGCPDLPIGPGGSTEAVGQGAVSGRFCSISKFQTGFTSRSLQQHKFHILQGVLTPVLTLKVTLQAPPYTKLPPKQNRQQ